MKRNAMVRRRGGALLVLLSGTAFVGLFPSPSARGVWRRAEEQEVKPSTEVKKEASELEAKEETEGTVEKAESSGGALAKEEWRPLEAFYEPSQDTIYNSWLSVFAAVAVGGGGLLAVQGLNAEYFILVFVLVVIAFGFVLALLGLKAITPESEETA